VLVLAASQTASAVAFTAGRSVTLGPLTFLPLSMCVVMS
jgi:hypothetical protein